MPTLYVVAGPNGSGKSTLTRTMWFSGVEVIDPDAIARDTLAGNGGQWRAIPPRQPAKRCGDAGRRTLVVETTLAGSSVLRFMEAAGKADYRIVLHYISVNSADHALIRIRNRVVLGGHDVPEADVRRRFVRSYTNLSAAIMRAEEVLLYDNTDPGVPHREIGMLKGATWWTAERLPGWAAAAIARVPARHP